MTMFNPVQSPRFSQTLPVRFAAGDPAASAPGKDAPKTPAEKPKTRFYRAKLNPVVFAVAKLGGRLIAKTLGMEIHLSPEHRQLLRTIARKNPSAVMTLNHSSEYDILALLETARKAGIMFNSMGAKEVLFEPKLTGMGFVDRALSRFIIAPALQRGGVMSVDRGGDNAKLQAEAMRLVKEGKYPFAFFPEGYVTLTNSRVEPLKNGGAKISYGVMMETGKEVFLVPVSMLFTHRKNISGALSDVVKALEDEINARSEAPVSSEGGLMERTHRVFDFMVRERETLYKAYYQEIALPEECLDFAGDPADPYDRLTHLRNEILKVLEAKYYGIEKDATSGKTDEMRSRSLSGQVRRGKVSAKNLERVTQRLGSVAEWVRAVGWYKRSDGRIKETLEEIYEFGKKKLEGLQVENQSLETDAQALKDLIGLSMYPKDYVIGEAHRQRLLETVCKLHRDVMEPGSKRFIKGVNTQLMKKAGLEVRVHVAEPIPVQAFSEAFTARTPDSTEGDLMRAICDEGRQRLQAGLDAEEAQVLSTASPVK